MFYLAYFEITMLSPDSHFLNFSVFSHEYKVPPMPSEAQPHPISHNPPKAIQLLEKNSGLIMNDSFPDSPNAPYLS